jgi:hypothetical protein
MKNEVLYIYSARRDKSSVKFLSSFRVQKKCYPTKLNFENINKYQISKDLVEIIKNDFNKNNTTSEIYIESAGSMLEIRKSLIARGYKNIPLQQINLRIRSNDNINYNLLVTDKNTMIQSRTT